MDKNYLAMEIMREIVSEFEWPQEYYLLDDLPDSVILSFPKSNFAFCEGGQGEVLVRFLPKDTQGIRGLHLGDALLVFWPENSRSENALAPDLVEYQSIFPSEKKTRDGIRNSCKIILARLRNVINGDFSWVNEYTKLQLRK